MPNSDKTSGSQGHSRRLRLVEEPLWLAGATRTGSGKLVANELNARLYLEGCPWLPSEFVFRFDAFRQAIVCGADAEPLTDKTVSHLLDWFLQQGFKNFPEAALRHAINVTADKSSFNPLQDWLTQLKWDGCQRLKTWLHRYLGAEDNDYHAMVGAMFLRSMVRRAMEPGCKADYMMVLEGPQRKLKSTVCRILASEDYFSDTLPDLSGDPVRLAMHARGKWLIEASELHAFGKADQSRLKQYLSSQREIYTPKYGRAEVSEPRTFVLCGTTNKSKYLKDETGGSRYWPVKVGDKLDVKGLERDRAQLFAEAYQEVIIEGRDWWPPPREEETTFAQQQAARYDGDAWETLIADWDCMVPATDANGRPHIGNDAGRELVYEPYYLKDIAFGALGIQPGQLDKAKETRLIKCLESMEWERANRTKRGTPWNAPLPTADGC